MRDIERHIIHESRRTGLVYQNNIITNKKLAYRLLYTHQPIPSGIPIIHGYVSNLSPPDSELQRLAPRAHGRLFFMLHCCFLVSPFGSTLPPKTRGLSIVRTNPLAAPLAWHECQRSTELSSTRRICYESSLRRIQVSGSDNGVSGRELGWMNVQSPRAESKIAGSRKCEFEIPCADSNAE